MKESKLDRLDETNQLMIPDHAVARVGESKCTIYQALACSVYQFGRGQLGRGQLGPGQLDRGQLDRGQLGRGQINREPLDRGQLDRGQLDRGHTC